MRVSLNRKCSSKIPSSAKWELLPCHGLPVKMAEKPMLDFQSAISMLLHSIPKPTSRDKGQPSQEQVPTSHVLGKCGACRGCLGGSDPSL